MPRRHHTLRRCHSILFFIFVADSLILPLSVFDSACRCLIADAAAAVFATLISRLFSPADAAAIAAATLFDICRYRCRFSPSPIFATLMLPPDMRCGASRARSAARRANVAGFSLMISPPR
jgi:hypothetical protein